MEIESQLSRQKYIKLLCIMWLKGPVFYITLGFLIAAIILELTTDLNNLPLFLAVVFLFGYYLVSILRAALSRGNRNFFLPIKYIFSDNEINITSPISRETLKWDAFIKWRRVGGYYLIYASSHNFLAVAKSAIPASDIATFESLLRSKIRSS